MKNDMQPGVNVEENPLAKALEIQTERVLNVLEVAMLQAVNDVRETFDDLSEADEAIFEAKLHAGVVGTTLHRHGILVDKLLGLGDTMRAKLTIDAMGDPLAEFVDKYAPYASLEVAKSDQ